MTHVDSAGMTHVDSAGITQVDSAGMTWSTYLDIAGHVDSAGAATHIVTNVPATYNKDQSSQVRKC